MMRYEAERAERRYRTVEPENRLVARGLESEWENRLRDLAAAEMELRRREQQRPSTISPEQPKAIERLGSDIRQVWDAATTTDRDRKELVRALLEEVVLNLKRAEGRAHLTLRWRGGAITLLDIPVPQFKPMGPRTDEDTISLLRRLATLYPDEVIAGILNRQERKTATGERFTANQVGSLRRYRDIPRFQPPTTPPDGELVSIRKAAQVLGMNTSSIHRWLADGFIAGEQITPGAPWQIRITDELRPRIVQHASLRLALTFSQAISKFFRLYTLSINEWTFFASVGLIQFASLLGRRCTGVSLIELFHLAALAHLVLFLSPILFAGCLP